MSNLEIQITTHTEDENYHILQNNLQYLHFSSKPLNNPCPTQESVYFCKMRQLVVYNLREKV